MNLSAMVEREDGENNGLKTTWPVGLPVGAAMMVIVNAISREVRVSWLSVGMSLKSYDQEDDTGRTCHEECDRNDHVRMR